MLPQFALLMLFQLIGELLVGSLAIPLPGAMCGMALLLGYLQVVGGPTRELSHAGASLLDNMGLLFVPAGAAIITYGEVLAKDGAAIVVAVVASTLGAIVVSGAIAARRKHISGTITAPAGAK
jgi:holin-like protein